MLPLEAADWVDFAGCLGIRKSFEVELFPLTFFDFDAAAAVGLDLGPVDFLEPLPPPPPLPLRWLGGDILVVLVDWSIYFKSGNKNSAKSVCCCFPLEGCAITGMHTYSG